jgi:hypothetical protein
MPVSLAAALLSNMERLIAFGTALVWSVVILAAGALVLTGLVAIVSVVVRRSRLTERLRLVWLLGAPSQWSLGDWPADAASGTRVFLLTGGPLAVLTPEGPVVVENGALLRVRPGTRPLRPQQGVWLIVGAAIPVVVAARRSPSPP